MTLITILRARTPLPRLRRRWRLICTACPRRSPARVVTRSWRARSPLSVGHDAWDTATAHVHRHHPELVGYVYVGSVMVVARVRRTLRWAAAITGALATAAALLAAVVAAATGATLAAEWASHRLGVPPLLVAAAELAGVLAGAGVAARRLTRQEARRG